MAVFSSRSTKSSYEITDWRKWVTPLFVAVILVFISFQNYLLFHIAAEIFAVIVAVLLCVVAWQTYEQSENHFLMYLGCGYFWIGALDGVHTLVYKGMNLVPITVANPATQFWIGSRYAEALLLLSAPFFIDRSVVRGAAFVAFGGIAVTLFALIMTGNFPDAFVEGQGLTPFKVTSEYVIIAMLVGALAHLAGKRQIMEPHVFALLATSIVLTMVAELSFTFYVSVFGLSNLVGHIFKFFSFYLIFVAVIREALQKPYLFLEETVVERTKNLKKEIAERKQAESALLEAKEEAERANRAKSEFLTVISHELRSPLNAIMGFAEIIKNQMFGPAGKPQYVEYAADIHSSGQHLLGLINDILDMSKIEAGKLTLDEGEIEVLEIVDSTRRLVRERMTQNGLTLSVDLKDDLPPLYADRGAVQQILLNLLTNSINYTPEGGRISVGAAVRDDGGVSLSVVDTGIGIAAVDIPTVLAPFGQVKNVSTRDTVGTGLGIPIVKSLIELHGGTLTIESEVGKGTTVFLRFPPERTVRPS
jgi:signal transduction histidine kinase